MKSFLGSAMVILVIGILTGCSQDTTPDTSLAETAVQPGSSQPQTGSKGIQVGIGDAEAQFWWALQIAERSLTPSILYNEFETKRETISKVEITVSPPYPKSLFIQSSSRHMRSFKGHAIRVDLTILLNDESILEYSYITGAKAMSEWHNNEVDIMPYLDGTEESVLIRGEARITMFKDVDESTITMDTPLEGSNVYSAKKLSNTVRVYFK